MIHYLNWESLKTREMKTSLHMVYKIFNHVTSISFNQYAQLSFVTTTRHLCHSKLTPTYSKKITYKVFVYGKNNSNLEPIT